MTPLPLAHLTKIGPIPDRNAPSRAIYLALAANGETLGSHSASPPDDAAALGVLAAKITTHAPRCSLELAEVGASLGFDVGELPQPAAEARAAAAYHAFAPDPLEVGPKAFGELCTAAVAYRRAHPWTKLAIFRRFHAKETLRVHNGNVLREGELLLQVHAGNAPEGPRLHVEIEDNRVPSHPLTVFRVEVTLASEPDWLADAVEDAYGERLCPRLAHLQSGMLDVPDDSHAALAAAAMRAAVDHMQGGAGHGRAVDSLCAYELEVDFANSLPLTPLPTGAGADPRAAGRLTARALAAEVPLPAYDDFVCVVLDRNDRSTERAMRLLDEAAHFTRASLPRGFEAAYEKAVAVEHNIGRWVRADHMLQMLENNDLPPERTAPLETDLPPHSLRVLLFGSHRCEAFFVDFTPLPEPIRREKARQPTLPKPSRQAGEETAAAGEAPSVADPWRDGRTYLPKALPGDWRVGERGAQGAVTLAVGPMSALLTVAREEGRRWVKVYFAEHAEGRPVTRDEAREVLEKLVGCGRFSEWRLTPKDAEHVPLAGARVWAAPLAANRAKSAVPAKRSRGDTADLIERAKVHLGEVLARVRDEGGDMRDYCVILDAKAPKVGPDGVVLTRALIEKFFASPENDPLQIRARFEEPRPAEECVVFVKHADGVEEMAISLESVERVPAAEA